jgi:hypothetical protein
LGAWSSSTLALGSNERAAPPRAGGSVVFRSSARFHPTALHLRAVDAQLLRANETRLRAAQHAA